MILGPNSIENEKNPNVFIYLWRICTANPCDIDVTMDVKLGWQVEELQNELVRRHVYG